MNRKVKLALAVCLVLIGGTGVWWLTKPSADAQAGGMRKAMAKAGTPVAAEKAQKGTMSIYLTGLGSVTPTNKVTVTSRVEGELVKLYFTEGQMVQKGQLLAQIDARAFRASLTQAQGQLAKDKAALENARQDLVRYRTLASQDSIAKQQLDAQIALVKQYQGAVQTGEGAIANAKLQLDYSRITAPISGRVGLRKVDPGNIIKANDANGLVDIAQISPIDVIFTLPQSQLSSLLAQIQGENKRPDVEVWDQSMSKQLGQGQVVTVDNQMDAATGTVKIKASFDNKDFILFPNQFVNVRMYVEKIDNAIMVPSTALRTGSSGDYLWVVTKDNTAQIRPITKGFSDETKTVITKGLSEGERVIVDGVERLKEGGKVIVVDPNEKIAPSKKIDGKGKGKNKEASK